MNKGNSNELNYYEILNLPQFSDIDAIKSQYKVMIKNTHPDKNNGEHCKEFEYIKEAYEYLKVSENKTAYDKKFRNKVDIIDKAFHIDDYEIDNKEEMFRFDCVQCFHLNEYNLKEIKIDFKTLIKVLIKYNLDLGSNCVYF